MKRTVPKNNDDYEYEVEADAEEDDDYEYYEVDDTPKRKSKAVGVLIVMVLLCGLLLTAMLVMSLPIFQKKAPAADADPDALMHSSRLLVEEELKDNPIVQTEPEETTEPTIPPEANPYTQYDFQYDRDNYLRSIRQESYIGVDVSAFQGNIDWAQVKAAGIQFAMIRLGYRGYGAKGNMVVDEYVNQNLAGATAVGLPIGAYFFSQATSLEEVQEEIAFLLDILGDYRLSYPLVLDWEVVTAEGRTKVVDRRNLTNMLRYFCDEMSEKGYDPMVYFNWTQSSKMLYLNELEDYPFWLALYQDRMTYPYRIEMWQYTSSGRVPGISGDVDIDLYIPDLTKPQWGNPQ